jgi:hypothetical protein
MATAIKLTSSVNSSTIGQASSQDGRAAKPIELWRVGRIRVEMTLRLRILLKLILAITHSQLLSAYLFAIVTVLSQMMAFPFLPRNSRWRLEEIRWKNKGGICR